MSIFEIFKEKKTINKKKYDSILSRDLTEENDFIRDDFMMSIEEVILENGKDICLNGKIDAGNVKIGDVLKYNGFKTFIVKKIIYKKNEVEFAEKGNYIKLYFKKCNMNEIEKGGVLKK
ncbi:MAG: hypothetical protein RSB77_00170 [Bacilli bacterium]